MKKVLIFGAGGLVGNALQNEFLNDKNYKSYFSFRNDTDLLSYSETKNTIDKLNPDIIINSAAKVGGIYANDNNRVSFLLENLKINMNILESVLDKNKITLINLGSSCIYPLNAENPISESSIMGGVLEPTNSPYAMAKLTAIELGRSLNIQYGHKVTNLMPTNLYGPHDNFDEISSHVIPGLISRMHKSKLNKDKEFSIWGTGKPQREFLFVDDLAYAIKFIVENNIETDLINVGSNEEVSILELAKEIKSVVGFEGELIFDSTKPDGNPRKLLDSTVLNSKGWKAKTNLSDGLEITYNWFKENI
jgi:GDP-L-fucose synthase